jgi:hypothetical protein
MQAISQELALNPESLFAIREDKFGSGNQMIRWEDNVQALLTAVHLLRG